MAWFLFPLDKQATMFRIGGPRADSAEERRRQMEEERITAFVVYSNFATFVTSVLAIKASECHRSAVTSSYCILIFDPRCNLQIR